MLPQEQALCLILFNYYGTTFHFFKSTLIKSMTYVRFWVDSARIGREFDKLGLGGHPGSRPTPSTRAHRPSCHTINDRLLQLSLIAFCFGAFFEGAAAFGTPVAVTADILIGLGFSPLAASGLSLIANSALVAFGALGTPVISLAKVHGDDLMEVTAMIGRQLPFFSLMVPFWLIWAFAGRKATV